MAKGLVTVFGANGFLGRHVMRELVRDGWRIRAAVRRPHIAQDLRVNGSVGQIQLVQANIRFQKSIERALDGADAVINLANISHSKGSQNFNAVHTIGAQSVAEIAAKMGIRTILHRSTLGAHADATSDYHRAAWKGEQAVLAAAPDAIILRPASLYGPSKGIFSQLAALTRFSPVLPIFAPLSQKTEPRFSPVYVGDVAKAIAKLLGQGAPSNIVPLYGPESYTAKELVQFTCDSVDRKRAIIKLPSFFGTLFGLKFEILSAIPILNLLFKPVFTRDQLKNLLTGDRSADQDNGFEALGMAPKTIEAMVPDTLEMHKKYGQFHQETPS